METTLTTKGQITLPISLRKTLNLKTGDKIIFEETKEGIFILKPKINNISNLKGCIEKPLKPISLEEMDRAILENMKG